MKKQQIILALDFGGSKKGAAFLYKGANRWLNRAQTTHTGDLNAINDLENMLALADNLLAGQTPVAVGISFGGPVDQSRGVIVYSPHVTGWENYPLKAVLEKKYGVPVVVTNDANAAALGEYVYGTGQGTTSMVYITVSTGIGAGIVINGKLWLGADEKAGELGHVIVDENGPVCPCGKRGCLEALASGPAIASIAREKIASMTEPDTVIVDLVRGNLLTVTSKTIAQAAQDGDPLAISILENAAAALGKAIGNTANLINPQRFILGGGVMKSGEKFFNNIIKYARSSAQPTTTIDIRRAALGDDSPLWGAVASAESLIN